MANISQVAYCGLFCGHCIIYQQRIGELSARLLRVTQTNTFRRLASGLSQINPKRYAPLSDLTRFHKILIAMMNLDCDRVCRDGGGSHGCRIRLCCQKKHIEGCWQCTRFEKCRILSSIAPVHVHAHIKNLYQGS